MSPRSHWASLYRLYWYLCFDVGLHLLVLLAVRLVASFRLIRLLYRHIIPYAVIRRWKVVDESSAMLVMEHQLFRHIETELFVRSQDLPEALDHVRRVLVVAGDSSQVAPGVSQHGGALSDEAIQAASLRGRYCHHYPICIRRVLKDDTLISMTSGDDQVWYAISLISFAPLAEREGFFQVATFLAQTMFQKFGARPHWGKWCPLTADELVSLYPRFKEFRAVCESRDPVGVFRNGWTTTLFGKRGQK